jgi:hypothetical protein
MKEDPKFEPSNLDFLEIKCRYLTTSTNEADASGALTNFGCKNWFYPKDNGSVCS